MRGGQLLSEGRASRVRIHKSRKQEKRLALDIGGKTVSGSGSKWTAKGDAKSVKFLVEAKETEKESYSLKKQIFEKIYMEALKEGREPVMQIRIQNVKVAIISWEHFLALTEDDDGTSK